jgi:hypothetical protein
MINIRQTAVKLVSGLRSNLIERPLGRKHTLDSQVIRTLDLERHHVPN